jgi:VanZ family protein
MNATRVSLWAPVVVWAAVIFAVSSIPSLDTGLGLWDLVLRKLAHLAEYTVLGALLFRALGREPRAVAIGSAYAVTDEIHQAFVPGRAGSPVDWSIDTAGVVAGVLLVARARGRARAR